MVIVGLSSRHMRVCTIDIYIYIYSHDTIDLVEYILVIFGIYEKLCVRDNYISCNENK